MKEITNIKSEERNNYTYLNFGFIFQINVILRSNIIKILTLLLLFPSEYTTPTWQPTNKITRIKY